MKETVPSNTLIAYKLLVTDSPVAIYTCDREGLITYFNNAAEVLWGRTPELNTDQWCGSWKIYHPDGKPMRLDECPMAIALKNGVAINGQQIIIERPDHSLRNLLVYPTPFFDDAGTLQGAHSTLVDITGQKDGEEKQAVLSAIVESSDDAIISKSLAGIITSWNAGAERIFGYKEDEVLGKHISILIPDQLINEEEMIIYNIRNGQKVDHFKTTRKHKKGHDVQVSLTISPVRNSTGMIIGASKIARDISQQIKDEEVLSNAVNRLRVMNNIGRAISENLDVQSILQKVTDATTQITGASFGAFFFNTVDEQGEALTLFTLSGAPREAFEKFGIPRNTAIFNPTFSGQEVVRSQDITKDPRYGKNAPHYGMPKGHLPVVSYLAVPVISSTGRVIGGLFFGHPEPDIFAPEHEDIVVSIASQTAVALDNSILFEEVKKLNIKKDEFIAMATHELKTPLTAMSGYLQMLEQQAPDGLAKVFAAKATHQLEKLITLVANLFDISKIQAGKLKTEFSEFDFSQFVKEVVESFQASGHKHQIVFNEPKTVLVTADRMLLEQVIINLLTNAAKYSPDHSTIELGTEIGPEMLTVSIKDHGIGIEEENLTNIFSQFYRAEGLSRSISGLGLGLYISKEIISRHNGKIWVESKIGLGSTFLFSIPFSQK